MAKRKNNGGMRNSDGTFGSKRKATVSAAPPISVSSSAAGETSVPSEAAASESPPDAEPICVFVDDPEDEDYVFDEKDMDEEDRTRSVAAAKQLRALSVEWSAIAKKRSRGAGKKLFEGKHIRAKQRAAKKLRDSVAAGYTPSASALAVQTTLGFSTKPKSPVVPAVSSYNATIECIDLTSDGETVEIDHECNKSPTHAMGSTSVNQPDDSADDDDAEVHRFEANVIRHWVHAQEGSSAAGGVYDLSLDLELDELADKDLDKDGDLEDGDQDEETPESTAHAEGGIIDSENMQNATESPLEREEREDQAVLEAYARNTLLSNPTILAIEEATPDDPSDATPEWMSITDAIALINETIDKGKRSGAALHVAEVAPLMILRNFYILRTKGERIVAASDIVANMWRMGRGVALSRRIRYLSRFYLRFKRLPAEARGGIRPGSSLLQVESVQKEVLSWLQRQPMGSITPETFARAVTTDILPRCGYLEEITICDRTARRWLVKCGYTRKTTKKGVYEDGHEREDVVTYRNDVFLPRMAEVERRSVAFEPSEDGWREVAPELLPGERQTVVYWHDESCYHQKDFRKHNYLAANQQFLPGKGMGRLVHVSDFITNATNDGRLTHTDVTTNTTYDARVVIKPGAKGDPWWDTKQLLSQVAHALDIHDMRFGKDVEAVFIFDQSSAHASNGDGALNAFDMNKKDGAKRKEPVWYKDTVVPLDVPNVDMRGKVQTLMNGDQPKGTASVLAERGIFPGGKKKAKCNPRCMETAIDCCFARILHNQRDFKEQKISLRVQSNPIEMYWGYSKYLYRQVQKASLEQAAREVVKALDAVGLDKIKRYINRSYRFMDA